MDRTATAASASGKVLLAGGYLVLDRQHTGLVFGLDARIHVHIQALPTSSGVSLSEIIVRSPQFRDAEWRYGYRVMEQGGGMDVTQLKGSSTSSLSRNLFVETALGYALTFISASGSAEITPSSITILADDDYYSHNGSNSRRRGGFTDFGVPLQDAHKTGLGSSAALVTALTAALLTYYLPTPDSSEPILRSKVHNLAQAAHCAAQGKIGSGFDVAAAVYGSCTYRRFSPSVLNNVSGPGTPAFTEALSNLVNDNASVKMWDTEILAGTVRIPKGLRLVMCDVDCGSQTVGMVKNVLSWRKQHGGEAESLWSRLHLKNQALGRALSELDDVRQDDPHMCRDLFQNLVAGKELGDDRHKAWHAYTSLQQSILDVRSLLRELSVAAKVSIEPAAQTRLLDACSVIPGVVGGVVPGAGGYDAIALLVIDDEQALGELNGLLDNWTVEVDDGNTAKTGRVRMLGVRQDSQGIRAEDISLFNGWVR
ncbi:MAG: phosphomevalonate kinase [Caeruleum heppii]|nr:MAG: phosphomevalonate kinase [Caeruleum heppii]